MNKKMQDAITDTDQLFGTFTDQENIKQAFDASQKIGNGILDFVLSAVSGWLYCTCLTIMMVLVQPVKDLFNMFIDRSGKPETASKAETPRSTRSVVCK